MAVAVAGSTEDFPQQIAAKSVGGVLNATIIDDIWRGLQKLIGAHAMENYRKQLSEMSKR